MNEFLRKEEINIHESTYVTKGSKKCMHFFFSFLEQKKDNRHSLLIRSHVIHHGNRTAERIYLSQDISDEWMSSENAVSKHAFKS